MRSTVIIGAIALLTCSDALILHGGRAVMARTRRPGVQQQSPSSTTTLAVAQGVKILRTPPSPIMQEVPFWENGARSSLHPRSSGASIPTDTFPLTHRISAVARYVRFFITASSGLVVGLLSPFRVFLRTPTLTAIGGALLIGVLAFLVITVTAMQSTPAPMEYTSPTSVRRDVTQTEEPSMKRMMDDIYGDS
jgi:hypothetical protein